MDNLFLWRQLERIVHIKVEISLKTECVLQPGFFWQFCCWILCPSLYLALTVESKRSHRRIWQALSRMCCCFSRRVVALAGAPDATKNCCALDSLHIVYNVKGQSVNQQTHLMSAIFSVHKNIDVWSNSVLFRDYFHNSQLKIVRRIMSTICNTVKVI